MKEESYTRRSVEYIFHAPTCVHLSSRGSRAGFYGPPFIHTYIYQKRGPKASNMNNEGKKQSKTKITERFNSKIQQEEIT
jgi:hypothetical protein